MMDNQALFNIAVACAGGLALWVLNSMTRQIQKQDDKITLLEERLSNLKDTLPHDYVQKQDYREDIKEVKEILRQIFDKLDNKQDKAA
jgi:hypothetical protein